MAGRSSLPWSSKQPTLLKIRSAPRFIMLVACYGIFTVGEWLFIRPSSLLHILEEYQANMQNPFSICFSMAW